MKIEKAGRIRQAGLRFGRRASDDTLGAFNLACDRGDLATASELLLILEERFALHLQNDPAREARAQALLGAQARLWTLRCRYFGDVEDDAFAHPCAQADGRPTSSRVRDWLAAWLRRPRSDDGSDKDFPIKV